MRPSDAVPSGQLVSDCVDQVCTGQGRARREAVESRPNRIDDVLGDAFDKDLADEVGL